MFSKSKVFVATVLLLSSASHVYASTITKEGAEEVKQMIAQEIETQKNIYAASHQKLVTSGDITVTPESTYYAASIPKIQLQDKDGSAVNLGTVNLNILPSDDKNVWKISIALPPKIFGTNGKGEKTGEVTIGSQRASGLYNRALGEYEKLDSQYSDITFTSFTSKITAKADSVKAIYNLEKQGGKFTGPITFNIDNFSFLSPKNSDSIKVKSISVVTKVKDLDPEISQKFKEQISAIGESGQKFDPKNASPQQTTALVNLFTDLITKSADAVSFDMAVKDMSADLTSKKHGKTVFAMNSFDFGYAFSNLSSDKANASFNFAFDGIKTNKKPSPEDAFMPTSNALKFEIKNIPHKKLISDGKELLNAKGQEAQMAQLGFIAGIPQMLTSAGTEITYSDKAIGESFKLDTAGSLLSNVKALKGFTQTNNTTIEGLDKIIETLREKAQDQKDPNSTKFEQALGMANMLKLMGKTDPAKPNIHTYHVETNENGETLLNGANIDAMRQGLGKKK